MASSLINFAPLVATITGSRTMFFPLYSFRLLTIVLIKSLDDTIPIFMASGRMSSMTASICPRTKTGGTGWMARTPVVF